MTQQLVQMEAPREGLYASRPQPLPFARSLDGPARLHRR